MSINRYICELCDYDTKNKFDYNKHCKTKRHVKKVNKVANNPSKYTKLTDPSLICRICYKKFSSKSNTTKHMRSIHKKTGSDLELIDNEKIMEKYDEKQKKSITIAYHLNYPNIDMPKLIKTPQKSTKLTKTQNHGIKMVAFECEYCGSEFSRLSNRTRHLNICAKYQSQKTEDKEKIHNLEKEVERLKDNIKSLADDRNSLLQISVNTSKTSNKAMSYLGYITHNYIETPALEAPTQPQIEEIVYKDQSDKTSVEEALIFHYNDGDLVEYIGQGVVELYKKDLPEDQTVWSSDVSRLTYIIREVVGDNNEWVTDKGGIRIGQKLIVPLLEKIYNKVHHYLKSDDFFVYTREGEYSKKMGNIFGIMNEIESKRLEKKINKYIAPHFAIKM
jgi:hypothetical protein